MKRKEADSFLKEWVTILAFTFYGSLVALQVMAFQPAWGSLAGALETAKSLLLALIVLRLPTDAFGYWVVGWIVLWLPFFAFALWNLNRTKAHLLISYLPCLTVALLIALFLSGVILMLSEPDGPFDLNDPNPITPAKSAQQVIVHSLLVLVPSTTASAVLANFLIRVGMRLGYRP